MSFSLISQKRLARLAQRNIFRPTAIQEAVIPEISRGKNVVFRSSTGSGKTFAYLLPIIENIEIAGNEKSVSWPQVLVITPTQELALQIKTETDFLIKEISAISVMSAVGAANHERQKKELKKLKPTIVTGNTRRVIDLIRDRTLRISSLSYLILDEADALFVREQFEDIRLLFSFIPDNSVISACSATFTSDTLEKLRALKKKEFVFIERDSHEILHDHIKHYAVWSERRRVIVTLRQTLSAISGKRVLVFAPESEFVTKINAQLQYHNVNCRALYSGQKKSERAAALHDFRTGKCRVLVATDVAARGLDIPELNYVISLEMCANSELYIHRSGRTARCGGTGVCISIGDETAMRRLLSIEKELSIVVHPRILYNGKLTVPEQHIDGFDSDKKRETRE